MRISDWSSDVCSSDLTGYSSLSIFGGGVDAFGIMDFSADDRRVKGTYQTQIAVWCGTQPVTIMFVQRVQRTGCNMNDFTGRDKFNFAFRSEKRRVGKACVSPFR